VIGRNFLENRIFDVMSTTMGYIQGKNKASCLPQTGRYITKETINHHDGAIMSQVTGHVTPHCKY
jgi:hypothetical protein